MEKTNTNRRLVIDRDRWLRGSPLESCLLAFGGKMCCLGFYARQLAGAQPGEIANTGVPSQVPHLAWGEELVMSRPSGAALTSLCTDLISINDSPMLSDATRELSIRQLFAKMNVDVQFVGGDHA